MGRHSVVGRHAASHTSTRISNSGCMTSRPRPISAIAECGEGDFADVTWSPDGKWLAYTAPDRNQMTRLYLYSPDTDRITPVTTDRYDSYSPAWSPDGKWLYFLSDRTFFSAVQSPVGIAPAGAVLRQADQDLSRVDEAGRTLAVSA